MMITSLLFNESSTVAKNHTLQNRRSVPEPKFTVVTDLGLHILFPLPNENEQVCIN